MLLNIPEVRIQWEGPNDDGIVKGTWSPGGRVGYAVRIQPFVDTIEITMAIVNYTDYVWTDVWSFNCLQPRSGSDLVDADLTRTYMSVDGIPTPLAAFRGDPVPDPRTTNVYLAKYLDPERPLRFISDFSSLRSGATDDGWVVTFSRNGTFMAANTADALFIFTNQDRGCIHAAPNFGTIGPDEQSVSVEQLYFGRGGMREFREMVERNRSALSKRRRPARHLAPGLADTAPDTSNSIVERRAN
jgi:hypothetical protein